MSLLPLLVDCCQLSVFVAVAVAAAAAVVVVVAPAAVTVAVVVAAITDAAAGNAVGGAGGGGAELMWNESNTLSKLCAVLHRASAPARSNSLKRVWWRCLKKY